MTLKITKELIHQIITWIEQGKTKDTRNPNHVPGDSTILQEIKNIAKEQGMRFTQAQMGKLFKFDISKISDYSTLDACYYAKHKEQNTVTDLVFEFAEPDGETLEAADEAYLADKADVEEDVSWLY